MKKILLPFLYAFLCTLISWPTHAGTKNTPKTVKAVSNSLLRPFSPQLDRAFIKQLRYNPTVPTIPLIQNPRPQEMEKEPPLSAPVILQDKGVALSDGKGKEKGQHSIVPSAVTILGSPAIVRGEERTIMRLRRKAQTMTTAEYIPPVERERWRSEWEALCLLWNKEQPTPVDELRPYLTHDVPPATLEYLQQEYTKLIQLINKTQRALFPKVIYSFLQNEGRPLALEEKVYVNRMLLDVRTQVSILQKSINKDPYLLVQQKYWDRMFGAFNPLIKGILSKPNTIFRSDNREFNLTEFALHNPDGSSPYLPKSDSMIAGESNTDEDDDDFDEEQYAGTQEALRRQMARRGAEMQHKAQMIKLAEQERDELIARLPTGQRIAVINDDLLPLLNMQGWAKNGYLGKGAKVETFRDGFTFLQEIRQGKRYDIVITDLVLPDGGVAMMEDFRLLDSKAAVFASSKFYPGDGDDFSARELFNFGIDGYIWNNTNLNDGAFGYLQYLRQLNNYYYYKNKYGWDR